MNQYGGRICRGCELKHVPHAGQEGPKDIAHLSFRIINFYINACKINRMGQGKHIRECGSKILIRLKNMSKTDTSDKSYSFYHP